MPKYEVDIPLGNTNDFEGQVLAIGGSIIKRSIGPLDAQNEWSRQVLIARNLMGQSRAAHASEIDRRIDTGFFEFFSRVYYPSGRVDLPREPQVNEVKDIINVMFDEATPPEIPESIFFKMHRIGIIFRNNKAKLSPRTVIAVIERYGLSDGVWKKQDFIRENYGISPLLDMMSMTRGFSGRFDQLFKDKLL